MSLQPLPHHEMFLLSILAVTRKNIVKELEEILDNLHDNQHRSPDFAIRKNDRGFIAGSNVSRYLENLREKNFLDKNYNLTQSGLNLGKEGKLTVKTVIYLIHRCGIKCR